MVVCVLLLPVHAYNTTLARSLHAPPGTAVCPTDSPAMITNQMPSGKKPRPSRCATAFDWQLWPRYVTVFGMVLLFVVLFCSPIFEMPLFVSFVFDGVSSALFFHPLLFPYHFHAVACRCWLADVALRTVLTVLTALVCRRRLPLGLALPCPCWEWQLCFAYQWGGNPIRMHTAVGSSWWLPT